MKQNDGYRAAVRQVLEPYAAEERADISRSESMVWEESPESLAKINGILQSQRNRSAAGTGRRIGIGILASVLLAGVTCGAVEPIREKIANAFLYREVLGEDTMVIIDFDGTASDEERTGTDLYIPDGFEAEEKRCSESSVTCDYRNSTGDRIIITRQVCNEWRDMQFAYREGVFEPESLVTDAREYLLLRPTDEGGNNALLWAEDGYAIAIETTLSAEELIKIADSITADCEIFAD